MKFRVQFRGWQKVIAKFFIVGLLVAVANRLAQAFDIQAIISLTYLIAEMLAIWLGGILLLGSKRMLSEGEDRLRMWLGFVRAVGAWFILIGIVSLGVTIRGILVNSTFAVRYWAFAHF